MVSPGWSHNLQVTAFDTCGNSASAAGQIVAAQNAACSCITQNPSVAITAPTAPSAPSGPTTVMLEATSQHPDVWLGLTVDGGQQEIEHAATWGFQLDLPPGTHSLEAGAMDACGNAATPVVHTLTAVNSPPDAVPDSAATAAGQAVAVAVLANDSDPNGDPLLLLSDWLLIAPTGGTAVKSGSSVLYTPHAGFTGTDTFRYRVRDGQGGADSAGVTVVVQ